ncbi:MAG: ATP-dependent 6-phosphofructokinase [Myxococcota bacterium]
MRRIGVLTSGGDAPGMNPAIRAVTRTGIDRGWEVVGILDGYTGLLDGRTVPLDRRSVGGMIGRAGTLLGTSRCLEMRTEEGQRQAARQVGVLGLDAVIVIGGGGSQAGALALARHGAPVVGIASTIDNDLVGSDPTLGAQTAIDVALESIDRLRVTAVSHGRVFVVEVMGRDCGYLALLAAIGGGAEAVVVPEVDRSHEDVADELQAARRRGKGHAIVVVAEGARGGAAGLARFLEAHAKELDMEPRLCVLGHVQRGGTPGVADRVLGTRLGMDAIAAVSGGEYGILVGEQGHRIVRSPLTDVVGAKKPLDPVLLAAARMLSL